MHAQKGFEAPSQRKERSTTACGECRRRKQKCNQGLPKCDKCMRRFPEPVCEYGPRKSDLPAFVAEYAGREPAAPAQSGGGRARRQTPSSSPAQPPSTGSRPRPSLMQQNLNPKTDRSRSLSPCAGFSPQIFGPSSSFSSADGNPMALPSWKPNNGRQKAKMASASFGLDGIVYQCHLASPVRSISHLPVAPTKQNAMLIYTFPELLYRFKGSFDGEPDHDNPFITQYVPWCIQSPLLARTSLYISARSLAERQFIDQSSTMRVKGQAIQMLNEYIQSDKWISDEVLGGVVQFISIEWFFGEPEVVQAHLQGLREMVRLRGGFPSAGVGALVTKVALVDDHAIAMSLETAPTMARAPDFDFDYTERPSEHFKVRHSSPLISSESARASFASCEDALGLHRATASILDDMRFLIGLALSLPLWPTEQQSRKLRATATWIRNRICRLHPDAPNGPMSSVEPSGTAAVGMQGGPAPSSPAAKTAATVGRRETPLGPEPDAKPHSLLPDYPSYSSQSPSSRGTTPSTGAASSAALGDDPISPPQEARRHAGRSDTSPPNTPRSTGGAGYGQGEEEDLEPDPLYAGVRLAAILYSRAIASRRPFSAVCLPSEALALLMASWRIPLSRWRAIIGVFLFMLMSIMPTMSRIQYPRQKRRLSRGDEEHEGLDAGRSPAAAGSDGGSMLNNNETTDVGEASRKARGNEPTEEVRVDDDEDAENPDRDSRDGLPFDGFSFDDPKEIVVMAHLKPHSGFVKSILQIGFMQMAIEDWPLCAATMKRGLALQSWLRGGDDG